MAQEKPVAENLVGERGFGRVVRIVRPAEELSQFTAQETADMLDVSKSTLLRWEKEERIEAIGRDETSARAERVYTLEDVSSLLRTMHERNTEVLPNRPGRRRHVPYAWLEKQGFDPYTAMVLVAPNGYKVTYIPPEENE